MKDCYVSMFPHNKKELAVIYQDPDQLQFYVRDGDPWPALAGTIGIDLLWKRHRALIDGGGRIILTQDEFEVAYGSIWTRRNP